MDILMYINVVVKKKDCFRTIESPPFVILQPKPQFRFPLPFSTKVKEEFYCISLPWERGKKEHGRAKGHRCHQFFLTASPRCQNTILTPSSKRPKFFCKCYIRQLAFSQFLSQRQ